MKIKSTIILLAGIVIFCLTDVKAQTGTPPAPGALKAAEEMLVSSGANLQFDKNITAIITQYSAQIPADKRDKFVTVMNTFLKKYISWDVLKPDLTMMYAREFTEAELKQLTAFYKTPLGMKLNEKQPLLMQTGMNIGQQAVAAHQGELQQMIAEVMK
jgi:hypothetical protein